jgi:hypothetical protein
MISFTNTCKLLFISLLIPYAFTQNTGYNEMQDITHSIAIVLLNCQDKQEKLLQE